MYKININFDSFIIYLFLILRILKIRKKRVRVKSILKLILH